MSAASATPLPPLAGATVGELIASGAQQLEAVLGGALHDERERDAALITFLVTASGLALLGIGSAFWGLLFGLLVLKILPHERTLKNAR